MSDFLEEVFAAQAAQQVPRRRRRRRASTGFTGRRYAVLVTLMASLTAVPTWIMLRAGVQGIDQPVAATVAPLLPQEPTASSNQPDPPKTGEPWVAPAMPPEFAPPPPVPPARSEPPAPVLERRSVVDTGSRPVRKKTTKSPAKPSPTTEPTKASSSPTPAVTSPSPAAVTSGMPTPAVEMPTPPAPVKPPRLAQRPNVERPRVERPEPPRVEKPDLGYWESAWRARS